jgi:two-component system LytT family response regulator
MSRFRVLVVDDEPLAREVAVGLLRRDPEIDSVEACENGARAREIISSTHPDIVFLDIEMPGLSGMQLAEDLPGDPPVIVFTTAFSQYAVEAFDVAATDYVLKPFSDERFAEALGRAKRRVRERRLSALAGQMAHVAAELQHSDPAGPSSGTGTHYLQRLSLKHGERTVVLRMDEIVWIEAQDYCVMVHSTRGNHLVRGSLNALEEQLDPERFLRVHRTAIVSLPHVLETHDRDGLCLVLSDGASVMVSRSRKPQVETRLSPRFR